MSPEQLDSLVDHIENCFKKDLVLVKGFHSKGLQDDRRAKKVWAFKTLCLLNITRIFILNFLCLFPSSKTSTDFRVILVDTFLGFGSFGRLTNQIFLLGWTFTLNFPYVMHDAEKDGQLEVISHIKDHRKFQLTPVETIEFARYLKWMKTIRSLFIYVTIPSLWLFLAMAACLSSLQLQSLTFTVTSIFVTLINCAQLHFGLLWADYAFMMPVHSNNVLSILFHRLFERMKNLQRAHHSIDRDFKLDSKTREQEMSVEIRQQLKRAQVRERQSILKMIENVLREIKLHNETVKHILDKGISCLVPGIALVIVFFAGEQGDLLRHTFSAGTGLNGFIFYISLLKARDVYTLSLRLSSNLHSLQARQRGKGIKSQLQILRLIKRTSDCESWHHSIGFTVGNRGSLSPKLVLSSFFQTMTIALTFLNVKSAWKQ